MSLTKMQYPDYYEWIDVNGVPSSPDNDTAAFVHNDGRSMWYKVGAFHRECDLPAIIDLADNREEYCTRGYRHRDLALGPAIIYTNDSSKNEYWQWNIKTDSQGNYLPLDLPPEVLEWYEGNGIPLYPDIPDFIDDLTESEKGNCP